MAYQSLNKALSKSIEALSKPYQSLIKALSKLYRNLITVELLTDGQSHRVLRVAAGEFAVGSDVGKLNVICPFGSLEDLSSCY